VKDLPVQTEFDIAATINAILWPTAVAAIAIAYRHHLPRIISGVANRVTKLEVAGISIDLARSVEFEPTWKPTPDVDLRRQASAVFVTDSYLQSFRQQLSAPGAGDYAVIDLGRGDQWLASRMYIMSILLSQMKGIRALVFLDSNGVTTKHFVGWAECERARVSLARRFPWLEQAYDLSYAEFLARLDIKIAIGGNLINPNIPQPDSDTSLQLLQTFLTKIQTPFQPANLMSDYVQVGELPQPTFEHSPWITSEMIEDILGSNLHRETIDPPPKGTIPRIDLLEAILKIETKFIATVSQEHRFDYLIDRQIILEQLSNTCLTQSHNVSK